MLLMPIVYFAVADKSTNQRKKLNVCCQKKPTSTGKGTNNQDNWKQVYIIRRNNSQSWNIFSKKVGVRRILQKLWQNSDSKKPVSKVDRVIW